MLIFVTMVRAAVAMATYNNTLHSLLESHFNGSSDSIFQLWVKKVPLDLILSEARFLLWMAKKLNSFAYFPKYRSWLPQHRRLSPSLYTFLHSFPTRWENRKWLHDDKWAKTLFYLQMLGNAFCAKISIKKYWFHSSY